MLLLPLTRAELARKQMIGCGLASCTSLTSEYRLQVIAEQIALQLDGDSK